MSGFPATHWSIVLAAGDSASPDSRQALEMLCRTYWYPLYAFARRQGKAPEDARDLTQSFFERFLEKHYLKDLLQEKGRFRTFLLTTFKRFSCDQFDRSTAAKRGGGIRFVPLDVLEAESQFHEAAGQESLFRELKGYLSRPADRASYTEAAQRLGMTADAVAMAVMRLRRRYRAMVRAEVANTVATPAEIDEEMRYLVELLTA